MSRFACLVAALICFLGAGKAFADSRVSVTFINPGGPSAFWGDVAATMSAAADDLNIDLEIIHTNRDRIRMVEASHALAAREELPDYIILVNELEQAPVMLEALRTTGVPVLVLLNRMTPEQRVAFASSGGDISQIVASIIPDNEIAGYEMAASIISKARELGIDRDGFQLLALLGDSATPAALAREAGLMRALEENPDVQLVRAFPVMWNEETAFERATSVLERFDLDAVWSANDQIALGARRAAKEAGKVPGEDIVFAGLNWSNEGLSAVRSGEMTMTHGGHFFAGAWSMVMIHDLSIGRLSKGSHIEFPMSAVQSDKVELFLDLFGDRDWQAVSFRSFTLEESFEAEYSFTSDEILRATMRRSADHE